MVSSLKKTIMKTKVKKMINENELLSVELKEHEKDNLVLKAKCETKAPVYEQILSPMMCEFAKVLPREIITPERFMRICCSAMGKSTAMQDALKTQEGKLSVMIALMTCAELGLEPNGRQAHLIPFNNKITLIIDYKGLVELMHRTGKVANIHSDKVCEKDIFDVVNGVITHKVNYREDRGAPFAYYVIVTMKDGSVKSEIMTTSEVKMIQKKAKSQNIWNEFFDEMAKKTVFKRASKWLPLTPEIQELIEKDDDDFRQEKIKNVVADTFFGGQL